MASIGKILVVSGLVAGGGYLIYKGLSKANDLDVMINSFNFAVRVSKFKFNLNNAPINPLKWTLDITLDVDIINPSKIAVTIERPYVELLYVDENNEPTSMAHSIMLNDRTDISEERKKELANVTIGAKRTSTIDNISLSLPITALVNPIKRVVSNLDLNSGAGIYNAATQIPSALAQLYPYLKIKVVTGWKGITIDKVFALG